jgi:hypothetical protein
MREPVRVSDEGLHDLAAQCDTAAAALSGSGAPTATGPPFQASAAAVNQGHTLVTVAAGALAARVTNTGTKLRAAANSYTSTDGGSAEQIASVGRSVEV